MRILLIRLRLIGDVVFTTPLLRALKREFPHARLTYLVEREAADVVRGNPHLDEVIVVGRTRGLKRIVDDVRLARRLRSLRFDVVLDLHGGPRSSRLTRATGAPQRIGYDVPGRTWAYTRTVHRPRRHRPRHSVVNQWDLLAAIDGWSGRTPDPFVDPVEMPVDPEAAARVAERLRAAGVSDAQDIVVVHVSAGNRFRRWPERAFTHLVTALIEASADRRVILSSGPADRGAAARIAGEARARLGHPREGRLVDFGDFDIAELRALLDRSRLFVGGDTGPLHVAATSGTPIVAIFGPTLPARSAPWRNQGFVTECVEAGDLPCRPCDQRVCTPGDFRCLTTISPEQVIAAAERALKRSA